MILLTLKSGIEYQKSMKNLNKIKQKEVQTKERKNQKKEQALK